METLKLAQIENSPAVLLYKENNRYEISGKSLPPDMEDFYQPVLDWLNLYRTEPNSQTIFSFKLTYFNTASSKMILDILMIFEEMVEEGHSVLIKWLSLQSDEDMQEAGKEYEKMVNVPFQHVTYDS